VRLGGGAWSLVAQAYGGRTGLKKLLRVESVVRNERFAIFMVPEASTDIRTLVCTTG
jgi:hypothetical protein